MLALSDLKRVDDTPLGESKTDRSWKDTIDWRRVLNSLTKQELVEIILAHDMRGDEDA